MTKIRAVSAADRSAWQPLWDDYLVFYESELPADTTDSVFARIAADTDLHGAIAWGEEGEALGLVHWLFHPSTWSTSAYCYLEDLYVSPAARGLGVGTALIEHVAAAANGAGASKVYWLTHQTNAAAQHVYEKVAERTGFIHFEIRP